MRCLRGSFERESFYAVEDVYPHLPRDRVCVVSEASPLPEATVVVP